jgi:hypothetical protein
MYVSVKSLSELLLKDFKIELIQKKNLENKEFEQKLLLLRFENEETRQFYEDLPKLDIEENNNNSNFQDEMLKKLPKMCSRKLMIEWTKEYLQKYNNKTNKKYLEQELYNVPRTSLDLLPHYSR